MLRNFNRLVVINPTKSNVTSNTLQGYPIQSIRHKSDDQYTQDQNAQLVNQQNRPKQILAEKFPEYYHDGEFASKRISFVEFIDQALPLFKELGIDRDINAYRELLKIFPKGRFHATTKDYIGIFHAPQQAAAIRVLFEMERAGLKPDKEFTRMVDAAFSRDSEVWKKICRMNYWSMKGRYVDPNPLPEVLPTQIHQLAKVLLKRMSDDPKMLTTVTHSSVVPDSIDKTWIAFSQSPTQMSIISKLDDKSVIYIENGGLTYAQGQSLTYFIMKVRLDDETIKQKLMRPSINWVSDYNNIKMGFYGKPIKEKMQALEDRYFVDDGYVLATGITGTSSQDSVLSMLKILQKSNPKLNELSVVFRMHRQAPELLDPSADQKSDQQQSRPN